MARHYSSIAQETELTSGASASATSMTVAALVGWPTTTPFTAVIDPDTASEEIVTVTEVGGTTLTVIRGEDGSTGIEHDAGAAVRHMLTARDLRDGQEHIAGSTNVHGVGLGNAVVGTGTAQTLTNKDISGSSNTLSNIPKSAVSGLSADLTSLDSAISLTQGDLSSHKSDTTVHGVSGSVVGTNNVQTLNNKTLASPAITNPPSNVANPPGTILLWGGSSTPPSGYLYCNGAAVSRTTYAALYNAIGTSYGAGNGSSTFNLPDFAGAVPVGIHTGVGQFNAMGKTGGDRNVTLTTGNLPAHTHSIAHTHSGNTGASSIEANFSTDTSGGSQSISRVAGGDTVDGHYNGLISGSSHTHSFTTSSQSTTTSGSVGSGDSFSVVQPYLVVRFIIKT